MKFCLHSLTHLSTAHSEMWVRVSRSPRSESQFALFGVVSLLPLPSSSQPLIKFALSHGDGDYSNDNDHKSTSIGYPSNGHTRNLHSTHIDTQTAHNDREVIGWWVLRELCRMIVARHSFDSNGGCGECAGALTLCWPLLLDVRHGESQRKLAVLLFFSSTPPPRSYQDDEWLNYYLPPPTAGPVPVPVTN